MISGGLDQLRYRDGTSQAQRKLPALDPAYFQMDERSIRDLIEFGQAYSKELLYYNEQNQPDGDWSAFLEGDPAEMEAFLKDPSIFDQQAEKKAKYARPHLVLFLTFLQLLKHTQDHLNGLTARHLEFFYRKALQLNNQKAIPDQAFLIASLDEQTEQLLIPGGSEFLAGQDITDVDRIYRSKEDLLVNKAQISQIMSIHLDRDIIGLPQIRETEENKEDGGFYKMLQLTYGNAGLDSILPSFPDSQAANQLHVMSPALIDNLDHVIYFISSTLYLRLSTYRRIIALFKNWEEQTRWNTINAILAKVYANRTQQAADTFSYSDPRNFDQNFTTAIGFDPEHGLAFDGLPEINSLYDLYRVYLRVATDKYRQHLSIEERDKAKFNFDRLRAFIIRPMNPQNPERERFGLGFPDPGDGKILKDFEDMMKLRMAGIGTLREIIDILRNLVQQENLSISITAQNLNEFTYLDDLNANGAHLLEQYFKEFLGLNAAPQISPFIDAPAPPSWTIYYDEILANIQDYFKMGLSNYHFIREVFRAEHPTLQTKERTGNTGQSTNVQRQPDWKWAKIYELFGTAYRELASHSPVLFPEKFFEEKVSLPSNTQLSNLKYKLSKKPLEGLKKQDFKIQSPINSKIKIQSFDPSTREITLDLSERSNEAELIVQYQFELPYIASDLVPADIRWKNLFKAHDASKVAVATRTSSELTRWKTFGRVEASEFVQKGQLGFAICSPLLHLTEGRRTITLAIGFDPDGFDQNKQLLKELLDNVPPEEMPTRLPLEFQFSTSNGFLPVQNIKSIQSGIINIEQANLSYTHAIQFVLELDETFPALSVLPDSNFTHKWPMLEIRLKNALVPKYNDEQEIITYYKAYEIFLELQITHLRIDVEVIGLKNLSLQNDETELDPSKPFEPFGVSPLTGNSLYFSHPELIAQRLDMLELNLNWMNLPEIGLGAYYHAYKTLAPTAQLNIPIDSHESFRSQLYFHDGQSKHTLIPDHSLFPETTKSSIGLTKNEIPKQIESPEIAYQRLAYSEVEEEVIGLNRYFELELSGPDFQHVHYPTLIDRQAYYLVNGAFYEDGKEEFLSPIGTGNVYILKQKPVPGLSKENFVVLNSAISILDYDEKAGTITLSANDPNAKINYRFNPHQDLILYPPFSPILNAIEASYSSHIEFQLQQDRPNQSALLLHIMPFGYEKMELGAATTKTDVSVNSGDSNIQQVSTESSAIQNQAFRLLPSFQHAGELYLGIKDLKPPQSLSILIQMAEGSGNPDLKAAEVSWEYLSGIHWKSLQDGALVKDETRGLLTSGIIQFSLPADISSQHIQLPTGLHWLRARVKDRADSISDTVSIVTQAFKVEFVDNGNAASHYSGALAAEQIVEPSIPIPGLESIIQPFPSFRGKAAEQETAFYTRVSERLRHKQRALSLWDYERLILENFPEIYKAKALPTDLLKDPTELGAVEIVLIPNITGKQLYDPFEPKVSHDLLDEISFFLKKHAPPFANIRVKNPRYYYLLVRVSVRFRDMSNPGFYLQKLDQELREYLSPWAFKSASEIVFGGEIYESVIVNFLETRPYIDFIEAPGLILLRKEADGIVKPIEKIFRGEDGHIEIQEADVIIASAPTHRIELIPVDQLRSSTTSDGIGYLEIELDFQVNQTLNKSE